MLMPTSAEQLIDEVRALRKADTPWLILGGGSNLVVSDEPLPSTVIRIGSAMSSVIVKEREDKITFAVEAGTPWEEVVQFAEQEGAHGLECLSGIPGLAGATPIQNVGAYGQEVADAIVQVDVYDSYQDRVRSISHAHCGFAYRHSIFRDAIRNEPDRYIVLRVIFALPRSTQGRFAASKALHYAELVKALGIGPGGNAPIGEVSACVRSLRASKGMVLSSTDPDSVSAGSFFTNPILDATAWQASAALIRAAGLEPPQAFAAGDGRVKVAAAWLIERAGFAKGFKIDLTARVGVSKKHSLSLVNLGGGSTKELMHLARTIRDGVKQKFGVQLQPEPVFWGKDGPRVDWL
jgi:UDP-N-acetylmuramate dehydrogenase